MLVEIEQVGSEYNGEGYKKIKVVLQIVKPIKPFKPDTFNWNPPAKGADPTYIKDYKAAKQRYDAEVKEYECQLQLYREHWNDINKLHLGFAELEQTASKEVA